MNCPRCGAPVLPQARQCANCGLLLVASDRPSNSRPRPNEPIRSGTWETNPGGNQSGQWSLPADQRPPTESGQWALPPDARPPDGAQGRGLVPVAPQAPRPGGQFGPPMGMRPPAPPMSAPPSRPNPPPQSRVPSFSPLVAGATLQQRRYRVLGPYRPAQTPDGRAPLGLPQWVAVDSARRGDRVTVMQLPFNPQMPIAIAERARETLADHLMAIEPHPALQRVLGSFAENGQHFLVLQHLDGTFLTDRVVRYGPLNDRLVLTFGDDLLEVLHHLERQTPTVLHGNVTPDAAVISPDGAHVRLLTPSPVLIAQALSMPFADASLHMTGYAAPEQMQNQSDERSDLYSLGATLYFAATGYDAAARAATIFAPPRQINPAVTAPTDAVLAKAVRQVSSQRYQHAEDMQLDITRARAGEMPNRDALNRLEPILPRTGSRTNTAILGGIISVVVAAVLVVALLVHGNATNASATESTLPTTTIDATAAALARQGIGLSTGKQVFDTDPLTIAQKNHQTGTPTPAPGDGSAAGAILAEQAGAIALQGNDYSTAISDFKQAVQDDQSNAEALIYLLDAQVDSQRATRALNHQPPLPFITLDVAASFSADDVSYTREVLRGAALVQEHINQQNILPGGAQLRIEIASIGDDISGAPVLARYFNAQLASKNINHTIGVVSWAVHNITPAEGTLLAQALTSLSHDGVPVVVPISATDTFPPNPDPNYFQLSPPDQYQGGLIIPQTVLSPPFNGFRVVIAQDPANIGDLEIAGTANAVLKGKLGPGNVTLDTLGKGATLDSVVHDAQTSGANDIIFAGSSNDAVTLATKVAAAHLNVKILASYSADDPSLIGQSFSPNTQNAAQTAVANPAAMSLLHIVTLADVTEWQAQGGTAPDFFNTFTTQFTPLNQGIQQTPTYNAIFAYDAVDMVVWAYTTAYPKGQDGDTAPTPSDIATELRGITDAHPFQGISGRIAFDGKGAPTKRALIVKTIQESTNTDANGNHLLTWKEEQVVGQFCATDSCTPTY